MTYIVKSFPRRPARPFPPVQFRHVLHPDRRPPVGAWPFAALAATVAYATAGGKAATRFYDNGRDAAKRALVEHQRVPLQAEQRVVAEARLQVDLAAAADLGLEQGLAGGELARQALGQPAGQAGLQAQRPPHELERPRLDQHLGPVERHPHPLQPDARLVEQKNFLGHRQVGRAAQGRVLQHLEARSRAFPGFPGFARSRKRLFRARSLKREILGREI